MASRLSFCQLQSANSGCHAFIKTPVTSKPQSPVVVGRPNNLEKLFGVAALRSAADTDESPPPDIATKTFFVLLVSIHTLETIIHKKENSARDLPPRAVAAVPVPALLLLRTNLAHPRAPGRAGIPRATLLAEDLRALRGILRHPRVPLHVGSGRHRIAVVHCRHLHLLVLMRNTVILLPINIIVSAYFFKSFLQTSKVA